MPIAVIIHLIFGLFAYTATDIFPKNLIISVNNSLKSIGIFSLIYKSEAREISFTG